MPQKHFSCWAFQNVTHKRPSCTWRQHRGWTSTSLLVLTRVPHNKVPAPAACSQEALRSVIVGFFSSSLRLTTRVSIFLGCLLYFQQLFFLPRPLVRGLNMTFRRLKKVNSSGPESGPTSQDGDIYFPSSKSDSCRTVELPSNSSEVYNYKTLAYSGGTLPRNLKKVRSECKTLCY